MKFKRITIKNFMRYKGTNTIEFACEEDRNVTVVLGDNTVGKTTLAQAFRWCLYGSLLVDKGKKESDYTLLNNDVIAAMGATGQEEVVVELEILDDIKRYVIRRWKKYRNNPRMQLIESEKQCLVSTCELNDETNTFVEIAQNRRRDVINELLPMDLSNYFLFDGEKWDDTNIRGMKQNIKESVHKLTGLSAIRQSMIHLKEMGPNAVIPTFKKKIKGGGICDSLQMDVVKNQRLIATMKENISNVNVNIMNTKKRIQDLEDNLVRHQNTEVLQKEQKSLEVLLKARNKNVDINYRMLVREFSQKGFYLLVQPMIDRSIHLLAQAKVERRDIPYMRQATIDYLLQKGECICGTKLEKDSDEYKKLLEQRQYLPPADMGSLLGDFERTASVWRRATREVKERLFEQATIVGDARKEAEDTAIEYEKLNKNLDENIDFKGIRNEIREKQAQINGYYNKLGEYKSNIENCEKKIVLLEQEISTIATRNADNQKWQRRIDIAEKLYKRLEIDFKKREDKVFLEINKGIQKNYEKMFNAKDKRVQVDKNYTITMQYKTELGYSEEMNLSEGEKIARNFAFVSTILEYNQRQKCVDSESVETMPIVLDGPFSKLGAENISLIARALPRIADQVIIFMLDKDWEHTKLDEFVGARYQIKKDPNQNSASIEKVQVI